MSVRGASAIAVYLVGLAATVRGQGISQPVRWQAQYTQIYSDDIETIAPALGSAFLLVPPASITSTPSEVISGSRSIKLACSDSATASLQTNSSALPLAPGHSYTLKFQYKILTAPSQFFVATFVSFKPGSAGSQKATPIRGAVGTGGTVTLTSSSGDNPDAIFWVCSDNTGAMSVDNIQITDEATGAVTAAEDAEAIAPTLKSGLQLQNATVTTDPSQVISGKGSVLLNNGGGFVTNPTKVPLAGNTVYTIKFDYRITSRGNSDALFSAWLQPEGTTDPLLQVTLPPMLKNAAVSGTFSTGARTADASSYVLKVVNQPSVSLVIDNIIIYRLDVVPQNTAPPAWNRLLTAPYPRLGTYLGGRSDYISRFSFAELTPFYYSVEQIERRTAFGDIIIGLGPVNQTQNPDSIQRIRALNPNAVILPSESMVGQYELGPPFAHNADPDYDLARSIPKEWKAADTKGNVIYSVGYPGLFWMDVSDFVPNVNGQTWRTALNNFVTTQVFPSGLWDGIHLYNMEGNFPQDMKTFDDPALFDYDLNRNGQSATPAAVTEAIRSGMMTMVKQLVASADGVQLVFGHAADPQFAFAPLLNAFLFEFFNGKWNAAGAPPASSSPAGWRKQFDSYQRVQATLRVPQVFFVLAQGTDAADENVATTSHSYLVPKPEDFPKHRLAMGTALLGNGFYQYQLRGQLDAPYWFDEYSVGTDGAAAEDRAKKGTSAIP